MGDDAQYEAIRAGKWKRKPERWKKVSSIAENFVTRLLEKDPDKRMTSEVALDHDFIKNRQHSSLEATHADSGVVDALRSYAQASRFRRACLSMMAWSLSMEDRSKVRGIFLEMDKSHQGTITLSEFKDVLEREFHIPDTEIREIFNA